MKKNVAGQVVLAQLVSKTDGSAVTSGTTTVYVTGDGGTQSTGSGTVTHEGNGCWSYQPTQAETNFDHAGFTFANASAISVCQQVYMTFPLTGDAFARLGAPAGASVSADVAAVAAYVDTEVAAIKAKTDALPTDPADASDIAASFATVNSTLSTIAGYIDTEVGAIKAKTDLIPAAPAAVGDIPSAATIADAVWDEATSGHATAGSTGAALTAAGSSGDPWGTALPGSYGAGTAGALLGGLTLTAIADGILKRDMSAVTGEASRSPLNALRFLRNAWTVSGASLTVKKEDDATTAWTAALTSTAGADPITGTDPA